VSTHHQKRFAAQASYPSPSTAFPRWNIPSFTNQYLTHRQHV